MNGQAPPRPHAAIPWSVLGAIVLVAAVESFVTRDILSIQSMDWRHAARFGVARAPGRDVLCFGDSMVKYGVLPRVLEARTGKRAYNLAIMTGAAPSSYVLLRRALDRGARPRAVVVDFARHLLETGPYAGARPYPWAEILTLKEAVALAVDARDPNVLAAIVTGRLVPSIRRRFEVRANVLAALRGTSVGERELAVLLWRNWNQNQGAQVWPDNPEFRDVAPPPKSAPQPGKFRCDPVNARYVERFLRLAQRHAIAVYWVLPPVSPNTQDGNEFWGEEARYTAFVRAMQARFPALVVVDGRRMGFVARDFQDQIHLDGEGAIAFTNGLADALDAPPAVAEAATRWVVLPAGKGRPGLDGVEDINQSRLAIQTGRTRLR